MRIVCAESRQHDRVGPLADDLDGPIFCADDDTHSLTVASEAEQVQHLR